MSYILSASDLVAAPQLTKVEVPELAKDGQPAPVLFLRPPTAGAVIDLVVDADTNKPSAESMLRLMAAVVVDANGVPLFSSEDISRLREMRMDVFNRISTAISAHLVPKGSQGESAQPTGDDSPSN